MVQDHILFLLLLALPSNVIVSGIKGSRSYPVFILNVILLSISLTYTIVEGLSVTVSYFLIIYSK